MCRKSISFGVKFNTILLSNWTHHISSCKGVNKLNTGKITALNSYFKCKTVTTLASCSMSKPNNASTAKLVMCHGNCKCYAVLSHTLILNVCIYVAPELENLNMVGNVNDKEVDGTFMCFMFLGFKITCSWPLPISEYNCTFLSTVKVSTSFLFD